MPTLVVSMHARRRFQQRGVDEKDVLAALAACHLHRPADDGALMHEATVAGRILKVVTVEQSCTGTLTIKTAMWKDR